MSARPCRCGCSKATTGATRFTSRCILSAHDVWTASISQVADDGGAILKTSDWELHGPGHSRKPESRCAARTTTATAPGPSRRRLRPASRVRVKASSSSSQSAATSRPAARPTFADHARADRRIMAKERRPAARVSSVDDGSVDVQPDEVTPTGGIFGSGSIVNVGQGTFFPYNADAIQGFTSRVLLFGADGEDIRLAPLSRCTMRTRARPSRGLRPHTCGIQPADPSRSTINSVSTRSVRYSWPTRSTMNTSSPRHLGANTDWIVTFPTKNYYVDSTYGAVPFAPFDAPFVSARRGAESSSRAPSMIARKAALRSVVPVRVSVRRCCRRRFSTTRST